MSAQSFVSSLLNRFSPARTRPLQRSSRRRSVGCEQLEPRQLLSAITVNVWHDRSDPNDQWTTLREAVEMANADPATADTITFPSNFSYRDVTLIQGQLTLEGNVTIDASAAGLVRIRRHDRAPAARVLEVAPGADVDIRNVVVEGGVLANQHGAGIYNAGQLDLFDSIVGGNELREASRSSRAGKRFSISGGAGIYNAPAGLLTLHNSRVGAVPVDSDLLTELNIDPTRFRDSTTGQTYFVQPNIASGIGGGILNEGTASLLDGSAVHGNRSWFGGGGIYNAGRMTLTASTVSSNTDGYNASNGLRLGSDGTGIRNSDRVRTEFSHALQGTVGAGYTDRATAYGGTPELTITQSSISDHSGWRGAGIYNEHVTLTVRQSTIENNTVNARHDEHGNLGYSGGGAIYVNGGTVNLFQSTLANNAALSAAAGDPISAGGAVFAEGVRTVVSETSTFSGNSADRGGAIYSATDPTGKSRALILLQSTLTANTATMAGGGIWHHCCRQHRSDRPEYRRQRHAERRA